MGSRSWIALLAIALSGCAAIAGLGDLQKDDCAGGCNDEAGTGDGASIDATVDDAPNPSDDTGTTGEDAGVLVQDDGAAGFDVVTILDAPFDTTRPDTGSIFDSGSTKDTGSASDTGSGVDTGTVADTGSGTDAGCGGNVCTLTNATSSTCNGTSCSYTCKTGHADCNAGTAPDTDGCECPTSSCCGTGCQVQHSTGIGQTFWDCTAFGTYTSGLAAEACAAYTGNPSQCTDYLCAGPGGNRMVCSSGATTCYCWDYVGTNVGRVHNSGSACTTCPSSGDPVWE